MAHVEKQKKGAPKIARSYRTGPARKNRYKTNVGQRASSRPTGAHPFPVGAANGPEAADLSPVELALKEKRAKERRSKSQDRDADLIDLTAERRRIAEDKANRLYLGA